MPAYIESTGRSFPNPIKRRRLRKTFPSVLLQVTIVVGLGINKALAHNTTSSLKEWVLAVCHWVRTRYTISVKRMSSASSLWV